MNTTDKEELAIDAKCEVHAGRSTYWKLFLHLFTFHVYLSNAHVF